MVIYDHYQVWVAKISGTHHRIPEIVAYFVMHSRTGPHRSHAHGDL
jgi:hypothetical protein